MRSFNRLSRRQVLRGTLAGSAITVALPILECALNGNGSAFASGAPLPTRFVTWFWSLGYTPGRWEPKQPGSLAGQTFAPEMAALEPVKDKINIFSALRVNLDGRPNVPHVSGWHGQLAGMVPRGGEGLTSPTIDTLVADEIGKTTRYRSLVASTAGGPKSSVSYLAGGVQLPGETSPAALYAQIFGPEFRDPNNPNFKPDPQLMARQSALSAVTDQRADLYRDLGSADRARLDEYFTSVRQLERQIEIQLEKPAPMAACLVPKPIGQSRTSSELETVLLNNKLMSGLLAHALACDQTRVANIATSNTIRLPGDSLDYHTYTHQEQFDDKLGYQPKASAFATRLTEGLTTLIQTLANYEEGDSTLLDRSLVLATTDVSSASTHTVDNLPVITAGRAGGAMKTGLYVRGSGDPATRVGLTVMQALRMPVGKFGVDSNETSRPFTEVLA